MGARVTLALSLCVTLQAAARAHAFNLFPRARVGVLVGVRMAQGDPDPGEPLLLTPLLRAGKAAEARRRARVPLTDQLGIKSYSGFFTVNDTYAANLFAWYFPPLSVTASSAPLLVWLEGGPGGSSLFGLFSEHGPLVINASGQFERRKLTWANEHHVLYVDNPVGSGFSFADNARALCRDQQCIADGLMSVLRQLLQMFPTLAGRELYVCGESYGGKYAPNLASAVLKEGVPGLTLGGVVIGNGLVDPLHQQELASYLYHHSLLDAAQRDEFDAAEEHIRHAIRGEHYGDAFQLYLNLLIGSDSTKSLYHNLTGYDYIYNLLHPIQPTGKPDISWVKALERPDVRHALHVGSCKFQIESYDVAEALLEDIMRSAAPQLCEVLEYARALIYNGQFDIMLSYPPTEKYLQALECNTAQALRRAKRKTWRVNGELAGYARVGGNLTLVLVRNAGHLVPVDQPLWTLDLITKFTQHKSFD